MSGRGIDAGRGLVEVSGSAGRKTLRFDHLVVAVGSTVDTTTVPDALVG